MSIEIDRGREVILAVDPGRAKCGVAVVTGPDPVVCDHRTVVDALRLTLEIGRLLIRFPDIGRIVVGSGTGSGPLRRAIRAEFPQLPLETIDEHRSSERARERYVRQNTPAGWRRIVPYCLRTPDRPYDDYVAWILAEDYFAKNPGKLPRQC
ncbi:MAG: pre-16S rRNA-processing nuclease YqgF [Capsulimonadaceae bacterium]